MNNQYLIPHKFKIPGWCIFIPSLVIAFLAVLNDWAPELFTINTFTIAHDEIFGDDKYFAIIEANIFAEIFGLLAIIGGLMVAFSKTKFEDEFIQAIRLKSLVWATYINYAILFLTIIFVFGMAFFWVLIFNMFTLLIFFIARFHYSILALQKMNSNEE